MARSQFRSAQVASLAAVTLAALAVAPGCVERKLVIESDPPGAVLYVDDVRMEQTTPVVVPVEWGGERRVTLMAPGHEVLETGVHIEDPWFTMFPIDVFAEFLWPATIEDHQTARFTMTPYLSASERLSEEDKRRLGQDLASLKVRAELYRAGGAEGPVSGGRQPTATPKATPKTPKATQAQRPAEPQPRQAKPDADKQAPRSSDHPAPGQRPGAPLPRPKKDGK